MQEFFSLYPGFILERFTGTIDRILSYLSNGPISDKLKKKKLKQLKPLEDTLLVSGREPNLTTISSANLFWHW